ncbi:predicted protein [Plenodomus lingam JN3]|uniref:Predicted protein n=1 Tax=Leptosphaeria maculans (strain JN3 / isolate v23.1.3 / race Av1-4-5-6-7-8) TaxID=985895 RepID=E4ZND9_LEPMJ|nr:predicted protein [Plenodomus lingam JN3]CBX92998.1 predicted protein [Plenodomus lingam JN3]
MKSQPVPQWQQLIVAPDKATGIVLYLLLRKSPPLGEKKLESNEREDEVVSNHTHVQGKDGFQHVDNYAILVSSHPPQGTKAKAAQKCPPGLRLPRTQPGEPTSHKIPTARSGGATGRTSLAPARSLALSLSRSLSLSRQTAPLEGRLQQAPWGMASARLPQVCGLVAPSSAWDVRKSSIRSTAAYMAHTYSSYLVPVPREHGHGNTHPLSSAHPLPTQVAGKQQQQQQQQQQQKKKKKRKWRLCAQMPTAGALIMDAPASTLVPVSCHVSPAVQQLSWRPRPALCCPNQHRPLAVLLPYGRGEYTDARKINEDGKIERNPRIDPVACLAWRENQVEQRDSGRCLLSIDYFVCLCGMSIGPHLPTSYNTVHVHTVLAVYSSYCMYVKEHSIILATSTTTSTTIPTLLSTLSTHGIARHSIYNIYSIYRARFQGLLHPALDEIMCSSHSHSILASAARLSFSGAMSSARSRSDASTVARVVAEHLVWFAGISSCELHVVFEQILGGCWVGRQ